METLRQDVGYAIRTLRKSPGFLSIAVLTLAIGIGANIALFTVVNVVLLRPLPFSHSESLVRIFADFRGSDARDIGLSEPEFEDLRDRSGAFENLTIVFPASTALSGGDYAERVELLATSPSYFHVLGANAAIGRVYGEQDARPGFSEPIVISDSLWHRQFGADPHVIGRSVRLDEDPYTVAGVMPREFRNPGRTISGDVDIWAAAGYRADPFPNPPRRAQRLLPGALARLKPGITLKQAQDCLDALTARLRATYPKDYPQELQWSLRIERAQDALTGNVRPMLWVLLAAVGFVLLIVCVNLAGLLLVRSSARVREISIRLALGASRPRILRQLVTESLLIALAGGIVAMLVLWLFRSTLVALMPADLPRLSEIHFDARALVLALLLSLGTGLLFGLTPALQASSLDPNSDLKEGGRTGGSSRSQSRFRRFLVPGEIALSVVLSVAAGLLIHSFWNMLQVSLGMDANNVALARIWIPVPNNPKMNRYLKAPQREVLFRELLRRAGQIPGVKQTAIASGSATPFSGGTRNPFQFELPDSRDGSQRKTAEYAGVTPDYLRVLRAGLIAGRFFTDRDSASSKRVVVVDRAFVKRYSAHRSVIGRRILAGSPQRDWEIVGVMADLRGDSLDTAPVPHVYFSLYQNSSFELALFLRTTYNAEALREPVTRIVRGTDPELPVYGVRTMKSVIAGSMQRRKFSLLLMSIFAGMAVFLTALGIYGLMSLAVVQRNQEFGIRITLGARDRHVLMAAIGPAMSSALIGVAAGLACAAAATRTMSSLLFGVSTNDPLTFVSMPIVLSLVALVACLIPARRATRVSPIQAIRY